MSTRDEWMDYALAMADGADRDGRELTLVASRLEGLSLDAGVESHLRRIVLRHGSVDEEQLARASRTLFAELAHWLLEFMVAASYVRQERGLRAEELAFAVERWFSRLGSQLTEDAVTGITRAILVKSLLNEARPFMVTRTGRTGIALVEAPLLVRVEHGMYRVTDEAENYLYHLDSTIDSFASEYSLVAARMGRELESRNYEKSSGTVMSLVATVGHVRLLMGKLVEEAGRVGPDEQAERYDTIRRSVDEIRRADDIERSYREEVARIWEGWSSENGMDRVRELHGEGLASLRSLNEGLRVLAAAKSWMYDEYATLSERCETAVRHYLRSGIVTTLFSLDDLVEEVARTDLGDASWLDELLLPATRPQAHVGFPSPAMITLDGMVRDTVEQQGHSAPDLETLLEGDEVTETPREAVALGLARDFASWLAGGGGSVSDWVAEREPKALYDDMAAYDLARLVSSLLSVGDAPNPPASPSSQDATAQELTCFSDTSWLTVFGPSSLGHATVRATKAADEVGYVGNDGAREIHGTLDEVLFEVKAHA